MLDFPWFLTKSNESLLLTVVNAISPLGRPFNREYAAIFRTDCYRSEKPAAALLGDYYWLRAVLLELTAVDTQSALVTLSTLQDGYARRDLETALKTVIDRCAAMPTNAIVPAGSTVLCYEALSFPQYPGETVLEKFIFSLENYQLR
jgi:hypothetical protein